MPTKASPAKTIGVLAYRTLMFCKNIRQEPDKEDKTKTTQVFSASPEDWFRLEPSHDAQTIPEWIFKTDQYKLAKANRYVREIEFDPNAPKPEVRAVAPNPIGNMQQEYFPPLAAETRPFNRRDGKMGIQ
jgi:hypothetical protein